MMNFSAWEWALFTAAILLAFCVRGGAGFGGGVVIAPLFALFMPLQTVVPLVAGISALTFIFSRNPLASAAVLLVACSCSISLATPIAMLASIGASSKRGILIKGGKYLELLAKADVLLVDKTGTLTLGKPQITDVILLKATEELTRTEVLKATGPVSGTQSRIRMGAKKDGTIVASRMCFSSDTRPPQPTHHFHRAPSRTAGGVEIPQIGLKN